MRTTIAGLAVAVPLLALAPAHAQQDVETAAGEHVGDGCSISQAMLDQLQAAQSERETDTKTRVDALLETALASPKTRSRDASSGGAPVVFPPPRPGS